MPAPIAPSPAKPTRSTSPTVPPHFGGGVLDRLDDPEIAGAAAEISGERLAELLPARVGVLAQVRLDRHEEARRAEAALQRMRLVERSLQWMQLALAREPLNRRQGATVRLHGEHEARAHGLAVELDRAGAAHALLAADLRAGEAGAVANEVGQQGARLDLAVVRTAVQLDADLHRSASSMARRASSM